jgi:glycosyltransferase involved in cell wall biosynthesis
MSILQQPMSGTARWAKGITDALRIGHPTLDLIEWRAPARLRRGGPLRKVANLIRDRYWFDIEIPTRATREQVDVLLMPANISSRPCGIPQVVSILDVNFLSVPGTYDRVYAMLASRAFRRSTRIARRLTTISEYSRGEIARHLKADPEQIEVVYPGLDPVPEARPAPAPLDRPYGLYVGATEPHKDVPLLLSAWREQALLTDLRLVIVGPRGRDHRQVEALAAGLNGRAIVRGPVGPQELEQWYHHASVFVFPSRTEGFGFPPLEAMKRGVPVVAARAGALPEVLGDAALFHEPGDGAELAVQVDRVTRDSDFRHLLTGHGRRRAATYTWSKAGDAMATILHDAITPR